MGDTRPAADADGIRTIMRRALSIYRARMRLYLALAALPIVPVGIAIVAVAAASPDPAGQTQRITELDLAAQFLLVMPICQAAVAYAVVGQLAGRTPTLGEVLRAVLPHWSVLIGTVVLSAIAILLGLVALVIPGIVMSVWFQFVGQVVILEQASSLDALRRCRELVRDAWWRTAGALVAILLSGGLASILVSALVAGALQPEDPSDRSQLVVPLAANIPSSILLLPFTTIAVTLVYLRLRARRPAP